MLLWRSQIRFLLRHPLLAVLTVLGIALGVAVIHATDITNRSASASFAQAHEQLHGIARYRIVGSGPTLPEQRYADLRRHWLAQHPRWHLLPVVAGNVAIRDQHWQLLGIDASADPRVGEIAGGESGNPGQLSGRDNALGLIGASSALISQRGARELGLAAGAALPVTGADATQPLRVLGTFRDEQGLFAHWLVTDIGTAQNLLNQAGQLSYIELSSDNPLSPADLRQLRGQLPPGLQLLSNEAIASGQNTLLDAFQFNLSALSTLALLVGCLLMFSAAQFGFWQRRPLLERLYWLGADSRRLLANLLLEALLIAAAACATGWMLGALLSRALLPLAAGTINELFSAQTIVRFGGSFWDYAKTAMLAVAAMLSAQLYLFLDWRREQRSAQTAISAQPFPTRRGFRYWLIALALAITGIGLLMLPGASLAAAFVALFAVSGAWLLVVPEIYSASLAWLSKRIPLSALGIALRDSLRHYRRLGLALAALCLALAAGLGIDVMVDSFRRSLLDWLGQQIVADLYVNVAPDDGAGLAARLDRDERIAALSLSRRTLLTVNATPITLQAIALPENARAAYPLLAFSQSRDHVWQALQGDATIVGEPLARKWHLAPAAQLILTTPQGARVFQIAAISRDYNTDYGRIVISLETYRHWWRDDGIDSIGVFLKNPDQAASLKQELSGGNLHVNDSRAIKANITALFDRTFVITRLLQLLVSSVALAALISTLLIHQLMQRRQHATLHALGLSRAGLLRLSLLHALPLGLAAGVLALPLGYLLAWLLVHEINPRAFGWSLFFHVRASSAIYTLLLALLLAALAALYPAWRITRQPIAGELSRE